MNQETTPKMVDEAQLIQVLCLHVTKEGKPRQHPRKALAKLVDVGQRRRGTRDRIKLKAYFVAGKFAATEDALADFMRAAKA